MLKRLGDAASKLDKFFSAICLVGGVFALAGFFHNQSIGEPWGWMVAFGLSVGTIAGAVLAVGLLVVLAVRVVRGPAKYFRDSSEGGIMIPAFGRPPMWGKLLSLSSADTSVIGAGYFYLAVGRRGVTFRQRGEGAAEIAFIEWSRIESVAPAVIAYGARDSNGIAVTVAGPDGNSTIEFTCAQIDGIAFHGWQSWDEVEELCQRMLAQGVDANNARRPEAV